MEKKPYFPPCYGDVDCYACEINHICPSVGKFQRNKRDFSYTSGRCPRLPDRRGFVEQAHKELYAATFPLVHAELGEGQSLDLTLILPGEKRPRRIWSSKSGSWYFHRKDEDGYTEKRAIEFECYRNEEEIGSYMESIGADHCIFRARILDYTI